MRSNDVSVSDLAHDAQIHRAMQALRSATWFALCEGDRYSALGRKAVANSFYNLLPMLAEVRKAMVDEPIAEPVAIESVAAQESVNVDVAAPSEAQAMRSAPPRLHLVSGPAIESGETS
ncbi:hypothetical protein [Lysobacter sp. CA199]|uniref:hypothetical protein n=1 Tax=Lysobacter sp. CA199 TaxID=3455608 RepID=UPI003F8D150A